MTAFTIIPVLITAGVFYIFYTVRRFRRLPETAQSQKVITLDNSNFQHHISHGITLVDFWASWCMPCKMMAPILNEVAEQVGDKARICKLNIEDHANLATKYSVRNIPTMLLFKNGRVIDRMVGVKNKDFLVKKIDWVRNK